MTWIDLHDSTVLVTGASRGIGAAIAQTLHGAGASVILHYGQGVAEAERIAADLGPERTHLLQADLAVPGAGPELWKQAVLGKAEFQP
jgi:NAD(P)-dependent dehydrogenase (short-subunit alcohol dehydrogenase family)